MSKLGDDGVVRLLHRISRVYAVLGLSVPVLGVALATRLHVLGDVWLVASIVLTVAAAALLATIATAFLAPLATRTRLLTLVPGVGGLLALRRARTGGYRSPS